jgi:CBS domain-containing protein
MTNEASLLEFERNATVDLVAVYDLVECRPAETVEDVLSRPEHLDLDHFPVTEGGRVLGVLSRQEPPTHNPDLRPVREVMQAVTTAMIVGRSDPLTTVIENMSDGPNFRLVLEVGMIRGIVTLSDLGRLPARALVFSRITHLEMLLGAFIRARCGADDACWMSKLSPGRRERIEVKYQELKSGHQNLDRVSAAQFCDKRVATIGLGLAVPESGANPKDMLETFERLRDQIAHAMSGFAEGERARDTARAVRELGLYISSIARQVGRV